MNTQNSAVRPAPFASRTLPTVLTSEHDGRGWSPIRQAPFEPLALTPFSRVLHYGQSVFEGLKAVRGVSGPALFRPRDHIARLNRSAERLCLPAVDEAELLAAVCELVGDARDAVPELPGSLYVRPVVFADDEGLTPDPAERCRLSVFMCPMSPLFGAGAQQRLVRLTTNPARIRSAPGGTGSVKFAGNYASAMLAKREAKAAGFDEVLWLDACERRFVEETGSMNVMFVIGDRLVTPPLRDTVLPGITRATLLWLARDLGIETEVRPLAIDSSEWRDVTEVFSAGTAAGTAPIGHVHHEGKVLFASPARGPICSLLTEAYVAVATGRRPSPDGWCQPC
jgi:branched-chain amino acid aminotransferase